MHFKNKLSKYTIYLEKQHIYFVELAYSSVYILISQMGLNVPCSQIYLRV